MSTPKLFVIAAPSGGGKTSIVKALLERHPEFQFSVSATTRPMRPGETDGKDYFFLARARFQELIAQGELVEYEELYGNYYGTLKSETDRALTHGSSMIFDVDVRGALSIKHMYGPQAVLIFIAPPSITVLEERLRNRRTEDEETLRRRMERWEMELATGKKFDHTIVNDHLPRAIDEVDSIIIHHLSHTTRNN
ncbi:MAG TPA: guanylate kinase [Bacteroidota bacterium]|nr:guanylate kinase [Bacteroidota bacterium]